MATENLKELLKEGVTLDEQNVGQLTEMFEQAIVAERIKLTESKDAEIAALNEQHAKALEDATVMANARIDEAIDVAVDKFIAESEERFVQADEYSRMKALFGDKTRFVVHAPRQSLFRRLGLYPVERDEGRVYPMSDQAASVVDVLRFYLTEKGGASAQI